MWTLSNKYFSFHKQLEKEPKKSKLTPEERQRLLDEEKEKRKKAMEEEKERRKQQREIEKAHEKARKEEEKMKRKVERDKVRQRNCKGFHEIQFPTEKFKIHFS